MDTTRYTYAGTDLKPQVVKGLTRREERRAYALALAESMKQTINWTSVFEDVPPVRSKRPWPR